MRTILSLGTYPIAQPVHGGQRRVAAFRDFYVGEGIRFHYASIYQGAHYSGAAIGQSDYLSGYVEGPYAAMPFLEDLNSGVFAASDPAAYQHFAGIVARLQPNAVQLEQPFMWPLVKRLRSEGRLGDAALIYSSQNVEAPLKAEILISAGVSKTDSAAACGAIATLEKEIVLAADIVFAVSRADADHYISLAPDKSVVVVPNGVARYNGSVAAPPAIFDGRKFLLFVGSAYPPNVDGFCQMMLERGLYFLSPEKQIAICGGVSDGIFNNDAYQADLAANSERAQFFPRIQDRELEAMLREVHVVVLPITFGGGSNLKTAQALTRGCWVIATETALRGFETFKSAPGVLVANSPREFRQAIGDVMRRPRLVLDAAETQRRETLYWDKCFAGSGFHAEQLKWREAAAAA